MTTIERLVDNLVFVTWLPAMFWIFGGALCLMLRRSRWGLPVWTLVATPAVAFLLLIGWVVFRSRGDTIQGVNGPAPGLILFMLTLPLTLLSLLVVALCPPPRYWRIPEAFLCVPALLVAIAVSVGLAYGRLDAHIPRATVKFIVPNGFTGEIWIRQHQDFGVPPIKVDGMTHYEIPASGRLTTAKIGPIANARRVAAEYANGQPILDQYSKEQDGVLFLEQAGSENARRYIIATRAVRGALEDTRAEAEAWATGGYEN